MSDFPRGWSLTNNPGNGNVATITLPATPGVVHVLTGVQARLLSGVTLAGDGAVILQVDASTPALGSILSLVIAIGAVAANVIGIDEQAWSGELAGGTGEPLTVAFNAIGAVTRREILNIQGHDI